MGLKAREVRFSRVYHPYWAWEEVRHNMWGDVPNRGEALQKAIEFTSDHALYGQYMRRVVREWPVSCENALTDSALNKRAWIGHAACALALQVPEDIVRQAWGYLTDEQRLLANREAERAIHEWTHAYAESRGVYADLGEPLLL